MTNTRKIPVIFAGARTGAVSKAGDNFGKKYVMIETMEIQKSSEGEYYLGRFGQGEKSSVVNMYFNWATDWTGITDFSHIKPLDIINLIVADVGTKCNVIDIELAESTGFCEKMFGSQVDKPSENPAGKAGK